MFICLAGWILLHTSWIKWFQQHVKCAFLVFGKKKQSRYEGFIDIFCKLQGYVYIDKYKKFHKDDLNDINLIYPLHWYNTTRWWMQTFVFQNLHLWTFWQGRSTKSLKATHSFCFLEINSICFHDFKRLCKQPIKWHH